MLTKRCTRKIHKGNRELSVIDFHKNSKSSDGLSYMCKVCVSEKSRIDRKRINQNPARKQVVLESAKRYRANGGKIHQLYYAAMERARKKELEFTIEKSDIIIPILCPILNITIEAGKGRKDKKLHNSGNKNSSPSIDRIDNSKGYTKDNIRVISWRANYLKNTATLEELVLLGEDAKKLK